MIHVQIQIFLPPGVGVGGEWDSGMFLPWKGGGGVQGLFW